MVSGSKETNSNQWKASCGDNSRDDHESHLVEESNSEVAKKKRRRLTVASGQSFLDYLLNFDLNSVSVVNTGIGSMNNSATPLNKNVYKNPSASPAGCEDPYHSDAQSNMYQECSIPVPTSCQIEVSGSCANEQSFRLEESSDSSRSQSLLTGLIYDQGLTCSPEPQVGLKTVTTQLCKETQPEQTSSLLPSLDSNAVVSEWSKTSTDALYSVPYREELVGPKGNIFTELSSADLHCQSNGPDESIKQLQEKQEGEVTLYGLSHFLVSSADICGIVCNESLSGSRSLLTILPATLAGALGLQASTFCEEKQFLVSTPSSKSPKVDQININRSRKIPPDANISTVPLVCAKDDNAAVENEDTKSSADSECIVIEEQEQLKSIDKDREDVTNPAPVVSTCEVGKQDRKHNSCKTGKEHSGQLTQGTSDPLNTESSVSMLTDLSQKPLCLLPTPDNNQVTESAGQDGLQKSVEIEEASYIAKLGQCKKKRSKHKLRKQTNCSDVLNAGNINSNRILFTLDIFLIKFSDLILILSDVS